MTKTVPELMNLLFSTFPARQPEAGTDYAAHLKAQVEAYELALSGMDIRDIEAGVTRFLQGRVEGVNPAFLPSAAVVGSVVRKCMHERLDRDNRARSLRPRLPAPDVVKTPESIAKFKAMMAVVDQNLAAMSLTEDAARERSRAEMFAKTNDMFAPDMSPEAVKARLNPSAPFYGVGNDDGEAA